MPGFSLSFAFVLFLLVKNASDGTLKLNEWGVVVPRDVSQLEQDAVDEIADALEDRSQQPANPEQKAKTRPVLDKVAKASFAILNRITKLRDEGKSPKEALDSVKILTYVRLFPSLRIPFRLSICNNHHF